jgi:hypothetical protein
MESGMRHVPKAFRWLLCISILVLLSLPLIEMQVHWIGERPIQQLPSRIQRPEQLGRGLLDRQWQMFIEQYFSRNIGLRSYLIQGFNEAKLRLFPGRPSRMYIQSQELGFYLVPSVERFNEDFIYRDKVRKYYDLAADRLLELQNYLKQAGVTFVVVPAPPKVRVYPETVRSYLVAPPRAMTNQAASYANVLSEHGVNVVNAERILRELKESSRWPFYSTTGYHWNYVAACQIANEILSLAEKVSEKPFFNINCSEVSVQKANGSDTDIAIILNILCVDRIIGDSIYPIIKPYTNVKSNKRKIILVGDSYSTQLVYAFAQGAP